MKKIILVLGIVTMALSSCKKEAELCSSNCGTVVNDGINSAENCYWLEIQNECSGNKKVFCFDQNTWFNSHVGDSFCVTNEPSW